MISYEQALSLILRNTHTFSPESVSVCDSLGRVLKEDIYSGMDMPPFNKSAVDGYALKYADAKTAPVKLKSIGLIQAGQDFKKEIKRGECVKIMTGARLAQGADCVVMVEDCRPEAGGVEILKKCAKGENICFKAEDIRRGQKVLSFPRIISPADVAVFASVGKDKVSVIKRPKVCVLNTGAEIIPAGHKLSGNRIYNSNGPMLCALLKNDGFEPYFLGIAKDNLKDLSKALNKGLKADALLISGGVSMGDYDLVPRALKESGVKEIFHKVNIKPGKPLFFGARKNAIIFGIPGNPVSNFLAYFIFVRPALYKMTGYPRCEPVFKIGSVKERFIPRGNRKHFVPVKITQGPCGYSLTPVASHGSADILSLSRADGFMVIQARAASIGERIPFITWKEIRIT